MIKKLFKKVIEVTKLPVIKKDNIECSIDEDIVDCTQLEAPAFECGPGHFTQGYGWFGGGKKVENDPYIGVPAPAYLEDDPWFGPAPVRTEKQLDYMEKEMQIKKEEEEKRKKEYNGEPCNMHQLMYEMATSNWNTVKETQGGSENIQEGPAGWNSGNGMGQFLK